MQRMRFLTDEQIREIQAQAFASEIADKAQALQRVACQMGLVLEIHSVADVMGVVTVRPRDPHYLAKRTVVEAI